MDPDHTSHDLLAHFDRPKLANVGRSDAALRVSTIERSDDDRVRGDERIAPRVPGAERRVPGAERRVPGAERSEAPARSNQKTAIWLLQRAAAVAILLVAATILLEFAYTCAAEHALSVAARAGATEATLPRATYQSVSAAIDRRLTDYPGLQSHLQLTLLRNGQPIASQLHASDGDRFSITLSVQSTSTLPTWLQKLLPWQRSSMLIASAERTVPGRKLASNQR